MSMTWRKVVFGAPLPMYEVKDASQRGAVVVFTGQIERAVVDVRFLP